MLIYCFTRLGRIDTLDSLFIITSILILSFWIYRASKFRAFRFASPDIFVTAFFILYISIPLLFFALSGKYPESVALEYYIYSLICLLLFLYPWQRNYSRNVLPQIINTFSSSSPATNKIGKTRWPVYLFVFLISLSSLYYVQPSSYGYLHGGYFAVFLFLARLSRPLLIYSIVKWFSTGNKSHRMAAIMLTLSVIPYIFISGRRSDLIFVPSVYLVVAVMSGKFTIRPLQFYIGSFLVFASFNILPFVRPSSAEQFLTKYSANDWFQAIILKYSLFADQSEAAYAALKFRISSESGLFDWFSPVFNRFTEQFVSSTLFGQGVKDVFTLPVHSFADRCLLSEFCSSNAISDAWWYAPTGAIEAYEMLGGFGPIIFLFIGIFVYRIYVYHEYRYFITFNCSPYLVCCITLSPIIVYDSITFFILTLLVYFFIIQFVGGGRVWPNKFG